MPWVRFDDDYPAHRKVRRLSPYAFRVHTEAICWAAKWLTDGYIPAHELGHVSSVPRPQRYVPQLVRHGLWHETTGGWLIHDYLDYQPSKAQVEQERKARAERQRRWRRNRRNGVSNGVSNGVRNASTSPVDDSRLVSPTLVDNPSSGSSLAALWQFAGSYRAVDCQPSGESSQVVDSRRRVSNTAPTPHPTRPRRGRVGEGAHTFPSGPRVVPDWCGTCDEDTRHITVNAHRVARCPDCHPLREGETA